MNLLEQIQLRLRLKSLVKLLESRIKVLEHAMRLTIASGKELLERDDIPDDMRSLVQESNNKNEMMLNRCRQLLDAVKQGNWALMDQLADSMNYLQSSMVTQRDLMQQKYDEWHAECEASQT